MECLHYSFDAYYGDRVVEVILEQVPWRGDSFDIIIDKKYLGFIDYRFIGWYVKIINHSENYTSADIDSLIENLIELGKKDEVFIEMVRDKNEMFKRYHEYDPSVLTFL